MAAVTLVAESKVRVLALLRERLAAHLQALTASQRTAQSGATHEEARQEHPKDTRAIEAQYLARGLADRVETLRSAVVTLSALRLVSFGTDDEIGLSALVKVEDDAGATAVYFLVPAGGGETVAIEEQAVQSLTPGSPLGRALVGKRAGDDVVVDLPGGRTGLTVVSIL